MKVKCYCWECSSDFTVNHQGNDIVKYCPLCGSELEVDDEDVVEEEQDLE